MSQSLGFEAEQMLAIGNAASAQNVMRHLRSKLVILTYLRLADEIAQHMLLYHSRQLLDWGAGAGQMSYLLSRRGINVTSYDYDPTASSAIVHTTYTFAGQVLPFVQSSDPVKLPFDDDSYDAVLSCGVLEHVDDDRGSLREINRILKPGGSLFIYQLPQSGSWLEFFIRRFKLGYAHERRYTARSASRLLASEGFGVRVLRRANMLPKSFTGLPQQLKRAFEIYPSAVLNVDRTLASVPIMNQIGGILEIIAFKR